MRRLTVVKIQTKEILTTSRELRAEQEAGGAGGKGEGTSLAFQESPAEKAACVKQSKGHNPPQRIK
jgi:hypothetical protein